MKVTWIAASAGAAALVLVGAVEYRLWRHVRASERAVAALTTDIERQTGDVRQVAALVARLREREPTAELERQTGELRALAARLARLDAQYTETEPELKADVARLRAQMACLARPATCAKNEHRLNDVYPLDNEYFDYSGRAEVSIAAATEGRAAVIILVGQSNAANYVAGHYFPRHYDRVANLSIDNGRLYVAQEPLLGADGRGGSFATRLADQLIDGGLYDGVVLAPIAISNSTAADWAMGGPLNHRIAVVAKRLRAAGLTATHILWHQGESDAVNPGANADAYAASVQSAAATFRAHGVRAPVFVAKATHHANEVPESAVIIREGQARALDPQLGVFAGPDTDTLTGDMRSDGSHFSAEGAGRHADLWLAVMRKHPIASATLRPAAPP